MLDALTEWMNGPYAGKTMFALRALCFILITLTALILALGGTAKKKRNGNRFRLLSALFSIALIAVLCYQATWQLFGARNIDFVRFMRRHNHRSSVEIRRGSILDRNGTVLAIDDHSIKTAGHRKYPLGAAAAHVVGYFDPTYGIAGVERAVDAELTGVAATRGEELRRMSRSIIDSQPVEGRDIKLTLNARLQRNCAKLMEGRKGAIVVLRPDTGEILVLFSAPSFDPLRPGGYYGDSSDAPFLNRAIQGKYPPGSTFKIAMAAIAANAKIAPVLDCPATGFRVAKDAQPVRDNEFYSWQRAGKVWRGFGKLSLHDAVVHSSNVYFAQLGLLCPAAAFNSFVERAGLNSVQPLLRGQDGELNASAGSIPVITDKDKRMRAQLAFGQGKMVVSPLHVAMWTSIIAADGILHLPHLDMKPQTDGNKPVQVISKAAAANVRDMLRDAVKSGTGRKADIAGMGVCGKTGTAQAPGGDDHSWFTCFTTTTTPKIVVTVLVERGGYGAKSALPVARSVLEEAERLGIMKVHGKSARTKTAENMK